MPGLSENKMAGVNSCFGSVVESEILKIQGDAVPQNIQDLAWKFSKDRKDLLTLDARAVSGHTRGNYRFRQISVNPRKPESKVALHPEQQKWIREMNIAEFISKSRSNVKTGNFCCHNQLQKPSHPTPVLWSHTCQSPTHCTLWVYSNWWLKANYHSGLH